MEQDNNQMINQGQPQQFQNYQNFNQNRNYNNYAPMGGQSRGPIQGQGQAQFQGQQYQNQNVNQNFNQPFNVQSQVAPSQVFDQNNVNAAAAGNPTGSAAGSPNIPSLPNRNPNPNVIETQKSTTELSLIAPPKTELSLNKYKTGENHLGDKDSDLEENDEEDDDFKQGLDFNDMKFDDSQKVGHVIKYSILIGLGTRMSQSGWS